MMGDRVFIMTSRSENFVLQANPHAWLMTADRLHSQALRIHQDAPREVLSQVDGEGRLVGQWETANKACFLLSGFALENALKAFLVYENPGWISNGRLCRHLRTHQLTRLQRMARDVPYRNRYLWVLEGYEAGLESWARYPCALTAEEPAVEARMSERLWRGYLRLMQAYGRRLVRNLQREWRGPHGFRGRWTFSGDFLSCVR